MKTTREIYESSAQYLMRQGEAAMEARTQARLLLDYVTSVRYAHLMQPDSELNEQAEQRIITALDALTRGCPLPYITQQCEFYGLALRCDERALIPRPETETLIEAAVARLQARPHAIIADLGTGSGAIAVSIAHALAGATVYATDAQESALELARENASRHGVAERVKLLTGSTQSWVEPLGATTFDAILSNPPYIATAEIESLQPQIRDWEPRAALDGGMDGLDCYRAIAAQCGPLLAPDGFLMVELGAGQFEMVQQIFNGAGWIVEPPLFDLAGIARVLTARRLQ